MRKLFLLFLLIGFITRAEAQTPSSVDSLKQYTGKYKFPDGSVVSEVDVTLDSNGLLTASSSAGSSELKKTSEKDVFELVAYNGLTTFKRSAEGKVNAVKIELNDIVLEGTKVESPSIGFTPYGRYTNQNRIESFYE